MKIQSKYGVLSQGIPCK